LTKSGHALRRIKNGPVKLNSSSCDLGSTKWVKTSVRRVGAYAGACVINVKAHLDRLTIAIAKIAEDALGALSTPLFGLKLATSTSFLETQKGFPSTAIAATP